MPYKNPKIGLLGVLGVWVISAATLSWLTKLHDFTAEELIFWRGSVTLLGVCIFYRKEIGWPDRFMPGYAIGIAFAALGAYKSIRSWGVNPTIIIMSMTPVVNIIIALFLRHQIPRFAFAGFFVMLAGILFSLRQDQWHSGLNSSGLLWSIIATIGCGVGNECLGHTKNSQKNQLAWLGIGMALISLVDLCISGKGLPEFHVHTDNCLYLALFSLSVGWFYLQAYIMGFTHLNKIVASVLVQGETPAVILVAGIFTNERMLSLQWLGICIVIVGVLLTKIDAGRKNE